jgi:hypothetical protein
MVVVNGILSRLGPEDGLDPLTSRSFYHKASVNLPFCPAIAADLGEIWLTLRNNYVRDPQSNWGRRLRGIGKQGFC